ncbi:MAG: Chagasin family peptidase inhibitor I42 [Euryarchaeota archaeon ADurb.BinA087]|nr:MAG: Chagasin family peptidase inhibitor I42 [Euryarchaeota archaeon ADurb.BinA087]HQA80545.1 protease inhibitor I42 family protein [Methanoregulaceae archaeon]
MTTDSWKKHKSIGILSVFVVLAALLILSGCTTQPTGTPTATPTATTVPTTTFPINEVDMAVYNETANNTTVEIPVGSGGLIVRLAENPSTGYSWNATVTSGLTIVDDAYEAGVASQGMVGAPGTHYWILSGTAAGQQKFSAIYMRPWENVTGSEDTFVLNVLVE